MNRHAAMLLLTGLAVTCLGCQGATPADVSNAPAAGASTGTGVLVTLDVPNMT